VIKLPHANASDSNVGRFRREVRIQAGLHHRNIVPIWHYDVDSAQPFFVMPRAIESLRDRLDHGEFGPDLIPLIKDVAHGLEHAHTQGVVHRDVTPENILIFEDIDGIYAAVADFGHGRLLERDTPAITRTDQRMGKEGYVSPEQYQNAKSVDARTDIYALGCILGEALTGKHPKALRDEDIPQDYAYIFHRARRQNPVERYQSVSAFLKALEEAESGIDRVEHPCITLRQLADKLEEAPRATPKDVHHLTRVIITQSKDEGVLRGFLPRLSLKILRLIFTYEREALERLVEAYDHSISGPLDAGYADTISDFYEKLYGLGSSRAIQIRIMERIPQLYQYNRPRAGEVLVHIVNTTRDTAALMGLRTVLSHNPQALAWCAKHLIDSHIPSELHDLFQSVILAESNGSRPA
jgi:serine/threonine protein kinase